MSLSESGGDKEEQGGEVLVESAKSQRVRFSSWQSKVTITVVRQQADSIRLCLGRCKHLPSMRGGVILNFRRD